MHSSRHNRTPVVLLYCDCEVFEAAVRMVEKYLGQFNFTVCEVLFGSWPSDNVIFEAINYLMLIGK